jgi:hypothetical protein
LNQHFTSENNTNNSIVTSGIHSERYILTESKRGFSSPAKTEETYKQKYYIDSGKGGREYDSYAFMSSVTNSLASRK